MLDYLIACYHEKLWYLNIINTKWFVCGIAIVFNGFKAPYHSHKEAERYYIVYGTGKLLVNDKITIEKSPTIVDIPSNAIHAMTPTSQFVILFYTFRKGYFKDIKYNFIDKHLN